ncbi:MAG: DUF4440 domain-containing protein [Gammaproteobacteria bacterium]|jgi:hypothetical protein|nr:DUF4440 domain-containing protein [Gammaproteobacteria bacterium]
MSDLERDVHKEIDDMHVFFVEWFNGTADKNSYEEKFVSRFDPAVIFIGPNGMLLDYENLMAMMREAHGSNPDFRIAIRDVTIRHESDTQVVATYTEWQRNAMNSDNADNGRLTTVMLSRGKPLRWLHVQETWLPEDIATAGPYNF